MSRVELRGVNKYYDKNHVLKDTSLVIEDGEFMTLLRPSDCDKTTTLCVVVELEKPQRRHMYMGDREIVNVPEEFYEEPGKRHLNLVFRSYTLWPHMTVFDNVASSLKVAKAPKEEIRKKMESALKRMRIEAFIDWYPSELPDEQRQRVATTRATMSESEVLLLNKSLPSLDTRLKIEIRSEIKRLHQRLGTTTIYVTHDQIEALTMSIKITIFFEGVPRQTMPPMELHQNPASLRVADSIDNPKVDLLSGKARISGDVMTMESVLGTVTFDKKSFTGEAPGGGSFEAVIGIRPELVEMLNGPAKGSIKAGIYSVMSADSEAATYLETDGERILPEQNGPKQYSPDQKVWLWINSDRMNVFGKDSDKLAKLVVMDVQGNE